MPESGIFLRFFSSISSTFTAGVAIEEGEGVTDGFEGATFTGEALGLLLNDFRSPAAAELPTWFTACRGPRPGCEAGEPWRSNALIMAFFAFLSLLMRLMI